MSNRENLILFNKFVSRISNPKLKQLWKKSGIHFKEKFFDFMYTDLLNYKKPTILELGAHVGFSTSIFLDICNIRNGKLYSVDIADYSNNFKDKRWNFIKSRDDNFKLLDKLIPKKIDILLIDTIHKAAHVKKIIYHFYPKLKTNGLIIVDDISWLYYVKKGPRDNFFMEINNKETFNKILEIFNANQENLNLEFNFSHSGVCKLKKKKFKLPQKRNKNSFKGFYN